MKNESFYRQFNANPFKKRVGDCVIRAISTLLDQTWEKTYVDLCLQGFMVGDLPNSNAIFGAYLRHKGFKRSTIEDCPDCYTVEDFCRDHPHGRYLLAIDGHVVAVKNGRYFDSFDSGSEIPIYYWYKR